MKKGGKDSRYQREERVSRFCDKVATRGAAVLAVTIPIASMEIKGISKIAAAVSGLAAATVGVSEAVRVAGGGDNHDQRQHKRRQHVQQEHLDSIRESQRIIARIESTGPRAPATCKP